MMRLFFILFLSLFSSHVFAGLYTCGPFVAGDPNKTGTTGEQYLSICIANKKSNISGMGQRVVEERTEPSLPAGTNPRTVTWYGYYCPTGFGWDSAKKTCLPPCPEGQVRDPLTGQCKPDPCKSKARQTATEGYFDIGTDPAGRVPTTGCYDGCLAIFSGQSPAGEADVGGVKHYFAKGSYEYNGMSCSSSDSSGSPGSAKPGDTAGNGGGGGDGSGDGEDNGEGDDDTGGDDEGGEDDTGTGGGGDNGDDEGEDDEGDERSAGGGCGSFYCSGDAIDCAIARSNYELLCLEQKKKYTDTNDCASAPVCDGDPILCATALTAFKQRCQMKWAETQNEFSDEFLTAKAQFDSKNVPELIKEQDASEWFKLGTHVSGSVQCPADFVVPVFGHEVSVPTSFLCQYLVIIALVLKTLAWLFVGRLIFGEL